MIDSPTFYPNHAKFSQQKILLPSPESESQTFPLTFSVSSLTHHHHHHHQLLIEKGLMRPLQQGTYFYLPMLQRSIDRAVGVVRRFMHKANADEIAIPALTPTRFWEESGRLEPFRDNLYVTEDKTQILGPVRSNNHFFAFVEKARFN